MRLERKKKLILFFKEVKRKSTMNKSELRKQVQDKLDNDFMDCDRYCVPIDDYKQYFDKSYIIEEGWEDEFFNLAVWGFDNPTDGVAEYSIIYYNHEEEFAGIRTGINTSSPFAGMSCCNWLMEDDE